MFELSTKTKKAVRYEPIERRRKDRRVSESDRRSEVRNDGQGDRRKNSDRRNK